MLSCHMPISQVGRSRVTTLEGLIEEGELHPVQQAFIDEQATQCGYCVNGMIISTAALLWKTPHPSDEQIKEALDGNLCRCGADVSLIFSVQIFRAVVILFTGPYLAKSILHINRKQLVHDSSDNDLT